MEGEKPIYSCSCGARYRTGRANPKCPRCGRPAGASPDTGADPPGDSLLADAIAQDQARASEAARPPPILCPNCRGAMGPDTGVCNTCGYDSRTGRRAGAAIAPPVRPAAAAAGRARPVAASHKDHPWYDQGGGWRAWVIFLIVAKVLYWTVLRPYVINKPDPPPWGQPAAAEDRELRRYLLGSWQADDKGARHALYFHGDGKFVYNLAEADTGRAEVVGGNWWAEKGRVKWVIERVPPGAEVFAAGRFDVQIVDRQPDSFMKLGPGGDVTFRRAW